MRILVIDKETALIRFVKRLTFNTSVGVMHASSASKAIRFLTQRDKFDLVVISMASVWGGGEKWKEIIAACGKRVPCVFIPDVCEITAISSVIMNNHVVCPLDTPAGKKVFSSLIAGVIDRNAPTRKPRRNRAINSNNQQPGGDAPESIPHFTRRQKEVLNLMVVGKTNREIANELDVAEGTVKLHSLSIYRSLGVSNRVQAVLRGQKLVLENCAGQ